jgi:hypothetical protein
MTSKIIEETAIGEAPVTAAKPKAKRKAPVSPRRAPVASKKPDQNRPGRTLPHQLPQIPLAVLTPVGRPGVTEMRIMRPHNNLASAEAAIKMS